MLCSISDSKQKLWPIFHVAQCVLLVSPLCFPLKDTHNALPFPGVKKTQCNNLMTEEAESMVDAQW